MTGGFAHLTDLTGGGRGRVVVFDNIPTAGSREAGYNRICSYAVSKRAYIRLAWVTSAGWLPMELERAEPRPFRCIARTRRALRRAETVVTRSMLIGERTVAVCAVAYGTGA